MAKAWLYPYAQEKQLERELMLYVDDITSLVDALLVSNMSYFLNAARTDAESSEEEEKKDWSEELALLILWLLMRANLFDSSYIYHIARNISAYNTYQFQLAVNAKLKVIPNLNEPGLNGTLSQWATQVAEIAKAKVTEYIKTVEAVIRGQAGIEGTKKTAADIIAKRKTALEGQIVFTSVNETGTLNSQLSRSRLLGIGALSYIWTTQMDERVRPLHAERQGKMFSWKVMPSDGHPGMPFHCRCIATPILEFDYEGQFPISSSKIVELLQYQRGVTRNQRQERDPDYMAALRSGKLTPGEITTLNADKTLAKRRINDLLTSGRLTNAQLQELYRKGR